MDLAMGIAPQPFRYRSQSGERSRDAYYRMEAAAYPPINEQRLKFTIDGRSEPGEFFFSHRVRKKKTLGKPYRAQVQADRAMQGAALAPDQLGAPSAHVHDQHLLFAEGKPLLHSLIGIGGLLLP